jgi:hypothetical protein
MIRVVFAVSGILGILIGSAASQQDAGSQQDPIREQHRPMTRAERLARINAARTVPDQPPATANPNPPVSTPVPTASPAQPAPVPNTAPASPPAATAQTAVDAPPTDQPPSPPQVTYRNGLLTVQAVNSTLGSLLTAIRNKAGIQFEGLEGGSERVAVVMGPAPEGDVLAAILSGSQFDFVVLERPDSPGIVQRVILSRRAGSTPAAPGVAGSNVPARTSMGDDEETPDETAGDPDVPQDTPARPPVVQAQPQPQPPPQLNPDQKPPTQEQLFQEMMRQQQQRQQQQQQQQPPEPNHGRQTPP